MARRQADLETSQSSPTRAVGSSASQVRVDVVLGDTAGKAGSLVFTRQGQRVFSQFSYAEAWLSDSRFFDISPDLQRQTGYQLRKPPGRNDSAFFMALADTEPDAWGRRVIARAHAKQRASNPALRALTELDYLTAVDDFSRVGALRLRDQNGDFLRTVKNGQQTTPVLLDLEQILDASRAVELQRETAADLAYLQGKATSLGGMRPKCTVLDTDASLAIGKFPSLGDERSVTRGEVLALQLAAAAGIDTAQSRIEVVRDQPVAIIRRFDRTETGGRIPYLSGASMLQANRDDERSYSELIDVMRSVCKHFIEDARQLWRRLVFNHLISNVDDHLQNIGFLYAGDNQWRLAPAFDLNPFPDKDPESKTWLSEASGPISSIEQLLDESFRFELKREQAELIVAEVSRVVRDWESIATAPVVGLDSRELSAFRPAFRC